MVDQSNCAQTGVSSVALHPLVIVNISDHFSRCRLHGPKARAFGALLGEQSSRGLEVHTSFELIGADEGPENGIELDMPFLDKRRDALLKVFPGYDIVGWYVTGTEVGDGDVHRTHSVVLNIASSGLCLLMNPEPPATDSNVSVNIFETFFLHRKPQLRKVLLVIESEEAERIGIETATRVDFHGKHGESLVPQCDRLGSAVEMLDSRLAIIVDYISAVQSGRVRSDFVLLRNIRALTQMLPVSHSSPLLHAGISRDAEDALVVSLAAAVAKGTSTLHKLAAGVAVSASSALQRGGKRGKRQAP